MKYPIAFHKIIICMVLFFSFFTIINHVQAVEIVNFEDIEDRVFYPGDFVDLGTVIVNNEDKTANLIIEQYVIYPGIDPKPLLEEITIPPNNYTMISDLSFEVFENSIPGKYSYIVTIYENDELITEKIVNFYIENTEQELEDAEVMICGDPNCENIKTIFYMNETAYILANPFEGTEIIGYVEYVGKDNKNLINLFFDGGIAEFRPQTPGIYEINILFSKEGFSPKIIEKNITFIREEQYSIQTPSFDMLHYYFLIAVLITFLIIILFVYYRRQK